MAKLRGAVYAPPLHGDLPEVAVILLGNEVIGARAVPSVEAGENFIAQVLAGLAAERAKERGGK